MNVNRFKFCLLLFLIGLCTTSAYAQQKTIIGIVTDEKGEEIIGASIAVKGTSVQTISDISGKFSIQAPDNGILVVSYIGYQKQEVPIGTNLNLKIVLKENTELLGEIVVVGYGVQKKETLSGSVTQVRGEDVLAGKATQDMASALQGTIPGLTITRTSSRPGNEGTAITLRGGISVNNDANNPMILIDGVEAYQWELSQINPNDVESISVLKDAAAAIYGTKAAAGVILVTTKRGKEGKVKVNYSGSVHVNFVGNRFPAANGQEWSQMLVKAVENDYKYGADHTWDWKLGWPEETWRALANGERIEGMVGGFYKILDPYADQFDAVYGTTWGQAHNVTISGGSDKVKILTSLGYANDRSLVDVVYDGQKKYNFRTNLDYTINDWVKTEFNVAYDKRVTSTPTQGVGQGLQDMYLFPMYNEYGQFYDTFGGNNVVAKLVEGGRTNNTEGILRLGGKLTLTLNKLIEGLSFQTSANFRIRNNKKIERQTSITLYDWAGETASADGYPDYSLGSGAIKTISSNDNLWVKNTLIETFYQTYNAIFNYNRKFEDHNIGIMAGLTGEKNHYEKYYQYRSGMAVDGLDDINLGDVTTSQATGGRNEVGMVSWLGRLNYDYKAIYLLEGTFRRDGSSRFSKENRWSNFFGVSGGIRLAEFGFMKDWGVFDNLKLRASYGEAGAQAGIGEYDYYSTIGTGSTIFGYAGDKHNTAWISSMTSSDRTWERVATTNFAVDFATLNNRLSGTFEYYIRNNNDMLISISYPATLGASAPKTNSGSFRANGWELQLNWYDKIGKDFSYNVGLSLSDAKTKITSYKGAIAIAKGYNNQVGGNAFIEGKPLNALYVYKTNGYLQNEAEVAEYYKTINGSGTEAPVEGTNNQLRPGSVRKVDLNNDSKITTDDLYYYGDANPHYQFGINLGAKYKGLDFSMFIQGVGKQSLIRTGNLEGPFRSWWMNQNKTFLTETWTETNTNARFPILSMNGNVSWWNYGMYNDINVMDCWYMRGKNISVGYTLPKTIVKKIGLDNLRFYISADNLFEFSNVADEYDPEAQSKSAQGNVDVYARTVSFGIDLTF
ncbi:SusC/RagA family TonB-linked outer membrane protein [Dysgonomonas macrotermitis]|uniref:TonB-linked outer membrane protein, SusC/RagA family n=1 Tax=Dysgonomonas macrotermitis TaxID=1346286 RepID=A0A1M5JJY2_9BACT|nr:TonB-dependent receptor [Dysgonomonas macrotermitis]SHG40705.1 TonB-linked outer membrane protein, SusC/RagA family [Dysgonomonas macrotermitis]